MTLKLLSSSSLSVSDDEDGGESTATVFDLNTLLGNDNGSFESAGVWFTASARNVTLKGRVLYAELQLICLASLPPRYGTAHARCHA